MKHAQQASVRSPMFAERDPILCSEHAQQVIVRTYCTDGLPSNRAVC